jgi:hypothetical protein
MFRRLYLHHLGGIPLLPLNVRYAAAETRGAKCRSQGAGALGVEEYLCHGNHVVVTYRLQYHPPWTMVLLINCSKL